MRSRLLFAGLLLSALGWGGCGLPPFRAQLDLAAEKETFGYSTEGRPIEGIILGEGPETCFLFGVIHGNEPLGGLALERFVRLVADQPGMLEGKRLVVLPVANPDGLARRNRANARGVDLNRNFPARSWVRRASHGSHPASEAETRVLLKIVRRFQPARILSIHSPLHCVNYDGPAFLLARDLARATGYPLRASVGYPTPGSFGSYAGEDMQIPTITLETGRDDSLASVWPELRSGLTAFIESSTSSQLVRD